VAVQPNEIWSFQAGAAPHWPARCAAWAQWRGSHTNQSRCWPGARAHPAWPQAWPNHPTSTQAINESALHPAAYFSTSNRRLGAARSVPCAASARGDRTRSAATTGLNNKRGGSAQSSERMRLVVSRL
jgi:hypothetical protein